MVRPGTFERVYAAIKEQLKLGIFRPGDRLEPAVLSDRLNASVTPVRDALHRLTGERLVEAPRHEGFRVPLLTESTLRHLYGWHHDLLLLAIMGHGKLETAALRIAQLSEGETRLKHAILFSEIVQTTGNPEHLLALQGLNERLEPFRRLEPELLDALEEEAQDIVSALRDHDRKRLRNALVRYHRRRSKLVPKLIDRSYQE